MKIKDLAISDTGFVFNPYTGESFTVNSVGYRILQLLKDEIKQEEIVNNIVNEFDVSKEQAEKDVSDFIYMLDKYGLLE